MIQSSIQLCLPGMKVLMCKWKDSNEVDPLAHLKTGRVTPPLTISPILV